MDDGSQSLDWRDLVEAMPGNVGIQVGEEFAHVSEGFAAAVGADAETLIEEPWQLPFAPDEAARLERDALPSTRSEGEWEGTVRIPGKKGHLDLTLSTIDGDSTVWIIEHTDGRERPGHPTSRERHLSERSRFAQALLDAVDDVFFVIGEDGTFHLWNDALAETTGYAHDEIGEMAPLNLIPEDQHDCVPGLREGSDTANERRMDIDILTKGGERIAHEFQETTFVDPVTGARLRVCLVRNVTETHEDVTETQELERELQEEHRFVQNIVDAMEDVMYVVDERGEFVFWNEELCDRFGYDDEDLRDLDPRAFLRPAEQDELPVEAANIVDVPDRHNVVDLVTKHGDAIPHELYGRTYTDGETGERYRVGIARDITERLEQEEKLRHQRTLIEGILDAIPNLVFAFDETGEPIVEAVTVEEFAGYSAEELDDRGPFGVIPGEDRPTVMERVNTVFTEGTPVSYETEVVAKDGERVPYEFRAAPLELGGEVQGVVGSARDVSERLERERELERQRDELRTLDRINELLLETMREVIQRASRDAVERAVCERLADSELYRFAWVGEREFDGDRIVSRTSAGDADSYLESVTITADESETGQSPAARALRVGEVQVTNVEDDTFEPWHGRARDHGFRSVAAVPLQHDDAVYGVLVVYADREDAFTDREQAGFDVLGRSVGSAIHAARSHDLLFADSVVELEFRIEHEALPYVQAASEHGCELSLEGYVSSGEQWLLYLDVIGATPEAVVGRLTDHSWVERSRTIKTSEEGGKIELVVSESALLDTVTNAGATTRSATVDATGIRLLVDAPRDGDVRDVVKHVTDEFPDATLLVNRECDRSVTMTGRPDGLLTRLTDRQREVMEAAYQAGYFAWPRESTAEEVASSLDLTAPTLHGHLRKAQETIFSELLGRG
jgi:PAS domain S-box-containing protein